MRQRTIPVKHEIQVQTDVNLIEQWSGAEWREGGMENMVMSEVMTRGGLLTPFSEPYLLSAFASTLSELKGIAADHPTQQRIEMLEEQLRGMMKRNTMVEGNNDYYALLLAKDRLLDSAQEDQIHAKLQITKLKAQLRQLQMELEHSRLAISHLQSLADKNKHYENTITAITTLIHSKQKPQSIIQALDERIKPLMGELNANLEAISSGVRSLPHSIRAIVDSYSKDLGRLMREPSEERLKDSLLGLNKHLQQLVPGDYGLRQWERAARCEQAETSYRNMLSLMRGQINKLREENMTMKALTELDTLLQKIDAENVGIVQCRGVMQVTKYQNRVQCQPLPDASNTRGFLLLLSTQLSKILQLYPQLSEHVPYSTQQLLQQIPQLVASDSLQRVRGMVVSDERMVRVDNVYRYEDSRERRQVFNLRVLAKALLEQLSRQRSAYGFTCALDESVLEMVREQALEHIDEESIRALFRPMAQVVEVERRVEVPTFEVRQVQQSVPLRWERAVVVREEQTRVVEVKTEVPLYVETPVERVVTKYVPMESRSQCVVEVSVEKEVVVERLHERQVAQEIVVEKVVTAQSLREVPVAVEVVKVVEVPRVVEVERVVERKVVEYREVEVVKEVPVIMYETRTMTQEVEVKVEKVVEKVKYVQIERRVPYVVRCKEVVYLEREKPVVINQVSEREVAMVEYRDRLVPVRETVEVIREVPMIEERELIREVVKEVLVTRSHFVKGDREETCREVEVVVQKPLLQEVMVVREVEVEKIVPLYVRQEVLVQSEVQVPYVSERVVEVGVERVQVVPTRQEVVKEVVREVPVPILTEKEIVRIETQVLEKIVEKIVEVPRVVEVEKIVEKIVVVPRIVDRIVQVEKLVERVVLVETPVLQVVEIQIPMLVIQEVEVIKEVIVEREVIRYVKEIQIVEKEVIREVMVEREVPVEVVRERRVPVEVIREVPVEVFRDRVEYRKVQIHEVKVETIEVNVPVLYQQKVPFKVEKAVIQERIVERIVAEREVVEKPFVVRTQVSVPTFVEVLVERAVHDEVAVEVPGPETIHYLPQYREVHVVSEKVIPMVETREVPREVHLTVQKLVENVVERIVSVPVSEVVMVDRILQVNRPISVMSYKEIPVEVAVLQPRTLYSHSQRTLEVPTVREKVVEVQTYKEQLVEVIQTLNEYIKEEVMREIRVPEVVTTTVIERVEVPSEPLVLRTDTYDRAVEVQERIVERVMERVVMMPQIVEVVRNIHHVSEVNAIPIAHMDQETYLAQYRQINTSLKGSLEAVLAALRRTDTVEARQSIELVQRQIPLVEEWIRFPKVLQVDKVVEKEVDKERVVLVPTENKEKIASIGFMLEKCVAELKRVRDTYKIDLNVDEDILKIFFSQQWEAEKPLEEQMGRLTALLQAKYTSFGSWVDSAPFMMNCFMEEHFALHGLISEANKAAETAKGENERLKRELDRMNNAHAMELCNNKLLNSYYSTLVMQIKRSNGVITSEELPSILNRHQEFIGGLAPETINSYLQSNEFQSNANIMMQSRGTNSVVQNISVVDVKQNPSLYETRYNQSARQNQSMALAKQTESIYVEDKSRGQEDIVAYVEKIAKVERKNGELIRALNLAENEIAYLKENVKVREIAMLRVENEVAALKQRELISHKEGMREGGEVRVLNERIKSLEWEIERKNKEADMKGRQNQQGVQKSSERENNKIKAQIQRQQLKVRAQLQRGIRDRQNQINQLKRKHNDQINALKTTQLRLMQSSQSNTQIEIIQLKNKINELNQQIDNDRLKNTSTNQNSQQLMFEITQLKKKCIETENELQNERMRKSGNQNDPNSQQLMFEITQLKKKCIETENELQNERMRKSGDQNNTIEMLRLKNKVTQLEMEIQKQKRKQTQPSESSFQITNLKRKIISLQAEIERLKNEIERLKRQLQRNINENRKSKNQTSNESFQHKMQNEQLRGKCQRQTQELQRLQRELLNSKNAQANEQLNRNRSSNSNNSVLEMRLKQMNANYTNLQKNYANLQQNYVSLQSDYSSLQNTVSVQNAGRHLDNKSAEFKTLESQHSNLQINLFAAQAAKSTLQAKTRDLERELRELRLQLSAEEGKEMSELRNKLRRLEIQLETKTRQIQLYVRQKQSTERFQNISLNTSPNIPRFSNRILTSPQDSIHERSVQEQILVSPPIRRQNENRSPSYRQSGEEEYLSSQSFEIRGGYKQEMSMRELIEVTMSVDREMFGIMVMIRVIQLIEEESARNSNYDYPNYTPLNIHITDFNPNSFESMRVAFVGAIGPEHDEMDGLYLAPEVLKGNRNTRKSCVFNLGIILDELLHQDLYFKTINDVCDMKKQFKVRDEQLNPILKNSLFEIMSKEPNKRLELSQAKRRLQLLSYIAAENRQSLTATRSPSHHASNN